MKKFTTEEVTRVIRNLSDTGLRKFQEILRFPEAHTNTQKWELGEKIENFGHYTRTRNTAKRLLLYYGFSLYVQETYMLLYRRIPIITLEKYEKWGNRIGWPITWSILSAAINCRYSSDCVDVLDMVLAERMNGNQARKYCECRGLYAHKKETRKQASMRVIAQESRNFMDTLRFANDRIADLPARMTAPEITSRRSVINILGETAINIEDEMARLLSVR
jgi:hypothetical protein